MSALQTDSTEATTLPRLTKGHMRILQRILVSGDPDLFDRNDWTEESETVSIDPLVAHGVVERVNDQRTYCVTVKGHRKLAKMPPLTLWRVWCDVPYRAHVYAATESEARRIAERDPHVEWEPCNSDCPGAGEAVRDCEAIESIDEL